MSSFYKVYNMLDTGRQKLFLLCKYIISHFAIFFAFMSYIGCVHKTQNIEMLTTNKTILNINQKLEDGTIGFDDIFNRDYGEYAEKDAQTAEVLDPLVKKLKICLTKSEKGKFSQQQLDKIFKDNMDKVIDILIDKNNLKYGMYGTDETRWFVSDKTLKAPFNYFQQQVVLCVSGEVLEEISVKAVEKIINTNKEYTINFGILWSVYGNGNKLEKCFKTINDYIDKREQEVFIEKKKLSKQQMMVLKEILEMKKFENIITDGFIEYVAKAKVVSKCKTGLAKAQKVFDAENHNINNSGKGKRYKNNKK